MNEVKYIISKEQAVSISPQDADRLIDRRNGTAALLFLYLLRRGGSFSLDEAAKRLGVSGSEIRSAAEVLESMALLEIRGIPAPAEELPEYSTSDMRNRTIGSAEFSSLVIEVQTLFGRVLSGTELKLLFGIYDYLALPPEVTLLLVSFCIERTAKSSGAGKKPSMRSIEREAYIWANREITTLDMAEEHLRFLHKLDTELEKVKSAIGIRGRELSSTERKYIEAWISLGFSAESLAIAYDKTVVKTGTLQWKYMNSIVTSWHNKALHSPEEIAAGDSMPFQKSHPANKGDALPEKTDLERMEKLLYKVKNGQ